MFGLWFSLKAHGLQIGKSGIYTVGVPFSVLFQKTDQAILVLATSCCTADDLAFSNNCRILTAKSCFKVFITFLERGGVLKSKDMMVPMIGR